MFSRKLIQVASDVAVKKVEPLAFKFFKEINFTRPANSVSSLSSSTKMIAEEFDNNMLPKLVK